MTAKKQLPSMPAQNNSSVKYAIVTPVRNEEARVDKTIRSVASQTIRPARWVIVDDGSKDGTARMLDDAARQQSWISVIHRPDRGFRKQGGGVIEAFYEGYSVISASETSDWDFLVKLDGDLFFNPEYFSECFACFEKEPKLGIGGGLVCMEENGKWVEEAKGDPAFHVRGATKIYRRKCWDELGGLLKAPGWDTLDEVKANMLGWKTYTFRDTKLLQLKNTGTADGTWKNWVKNGRANYITGYHPLFMFAKCLSRLRDRPLGIVSAGLWFGFCTGYFKRIPQVNDKALIGYLRDQQIRRLTGRQSLWSA